jgi:hypothetical protein
VNRRCGGRRKIVANAEVDVVNLDLAQPHLEKQSGRHC